MILLANRSLLSVTGEGAGDFLQNLITTNMTKAAIGGAHAGALLTPQGKIQFEFLVSAIDAGFMIETAAAEMDALVKRLTMYRLRLPLEIKKQGDLAVFAMQEAGEATMRDYRFQTDIYRHYGPNHEGDGEQDWYQQALIKNGVASIGIDFALNDVFPHDINFDQIGGMSFSKGCYVGQEVISRMHHKANVRKRLMVVHAPEGGVLATGQSIDIAGKSVGMIGNAHGGQALAICRIDKISNAMANDQAIIVGDMAVTLSKPLGAEFMFPLSGPAA